MPIHRTVVNAKSTMYMNLFGEHQIYNKYVINVGYDLGSENYITSMGMSTIRAILALASREEEKHKVWTM